jgi:hypothetical protein
MNREVWTIYNTAQPGWLTDNDTLIEWVTDVADARWFETKAEAEVWLAEVEIGSHFQVIRLK